jgi:hypothetical protein
MSWWRRRAHDALLVCRSGSLILRVRQFQSGFVHLPVAELLSLCVLKEKVAKEKEHPEAALSAHPALRVREPGSGFSSGLLPARKGESIPGLARCAA